MIIFLLLVVVLVLMMKIVPKIPVIVVRTIAMVLKIVIVARSVGVLIPEL